MLAKQGFPSILLGTLVTSLLGNLFTDKRVKAKITGRKVKRAVEERLEQARIFNAASSFNIFWNTKISKYT